MTLKEEIGILVKLGVGVIAGGWLLSALDAAGAEEEVAKDSACIPDKKVASFVFDSSLVPSWISQFEPTITRSDAKSRCSGYKSAYQPTQFGDEEAEWVAQEPSWASKKESKGVAQERRDVHSL